MLAFFYHLQLHESLLLRKKLRAAASRQTSGLAFIDTSVGVLTGGGLGSSQRQMLKSMSAADISRHQALISPQPKGGNKTIPASASMATLLGTRNR